MLEQVNLIKLNGSQKTKDTKILRLLIAKNGLGMSERIIRQSHIGKYDYNAMYKYMKLYKIKLA